MDTIIPPNNNPQNVVFIWKRLYSEVFLIHEEKHLFPIPWLLFGGWVLFGGVLLRGMLLRGISVFLHRVKWGKLEQRIDNDMTLDMPSRHVFCTKNPKNTISDSFKESDELS